eukprot:scaffold3808_cov222-Pinguiococcus_pyrenoidosus.AAC.8
MQLGGLKVFMSYDDMSNLVATSSVVTALILSFSIALATVPERETFDWPNWYCSSPAFRLREAMYDSEKFRDFAIFTLEQENYNFTVQLDRGRVVTKAFRRQATPKNRIAPGPEPGPRADGRSHVDPPKIS